MFVDALIIIGMLVAVTYVHELSHGLVAVIQGYPIKKLYFGIPITIKRLNFSTVVWKTTRGGTEYGLSWLFLGGLIDFHNYEESPWYRKIPVIVAGPISNLTLAFVAVWIFLGLDKAIEATTALLILTVNAFGVIVLKPELLVSSSFTQFVSLMSDTAHGYHFGWLLVWSLINIILFTTNMLPIPALDGGQIIMEILSDTVGKENKKYIRWVSLLTLYVLCGLMILVFSKDIVSGLGWLFNNFR